MKLGQIIILLVVVLVIAMFFFVTRINSSIERVITMLILVALSYWIGRLHQRQIKSKEARAVRMDPSRVHPAINYENK
jgi:Sec-independent protein secretion pathway component TatC